MTRLLVTAVVAAFLSTVSYAEDAPSGIKRTPLQKVDFPQGYSTVIGLAELAPGASAGRHSHPGIEAGYIFEGEVLMSIEGQPDKTLKAGDSYQIPAGVVHDVKTVGDAPTKVIATYVVEAGKALATPAP